MRPTAADFERSIRRSPARQRVLLALASLSVTYRGPLARAAEVSRDQLEGVLHGRLPRYSPRLALVPLGLARLVPGPNGVLVEITERGRRKARQLTARSVRREIRKRAVKREVGAEVPAPAAEPLPLPAPPSTATFTLTFLTSPRTP